MKKVKPKSVRKKAPRPSASKPTEDIKSPIKAFESFTDFKDGTRIIIIGMTDGSTGVVTTLPDGSSNTINLSTLQVTAFLRTLATQAVSAGLTMEDLL